MSEFVVSVRQFLIWVLSGVTIQNLMLTRMAGAGRLYRDYTLKERRAYYLLLLLCSMLSAGGFWALCKYVLPHLSFLEQFGVTEYYAHAYLWPLLSGITLMVVFLIVFVAAVKFAPFEKMPIAIQMLPYVCFSNLMQAIHFRSAALGMTLPRTLALALGNSIGVCLMDCLVRVARDRMKDAGGPEAVQGVPRLLVYLAGLSLVAYALGGQGLATLM